jgi:hypothetical protein
MFSLFSLSEPSRLHNVFQRAIIRNLKPGLTESSLPGFLPRFALTAQSKVALKGL